MTLNNSKAVTTILLLFSGLSYQSITTSNRSSSSSIPFVQAASSASASSASSSSSTNLILDLSHQPHIPPKKLAQAIQDAIIESTTTATSPDDDDINNVSSRLTIDLSSSELGDSGLAETTESLKTQQSTTTASSSSVSTDAATPFKEIDFSCRMSRLTPNGVTAFIKQNIMMNESLTASETKTELSSTIRDHHHYSCSYYYYRSLDFGWNNFHREERGAKTLASTLRKLVQDKQKCPTTLRFDRCSLGPSFCRSIAKGIMQRYDNMNTNTPQNPQPLSLSLCGNSDIADAGVAALAAAVRGSKAAATSALFRELDLSACGVGDAGAEALALALESHPACFDRLVLSHNKISDDGAGSIGNALAETTLKKSPSMILEIDGNKDLGDLGVKLLAGALGWGRIYKLSVRSCNIESDGMKDIAVALKKLALIEGVDEVHIDLSGNPIGTLRKKKKEKKYSASALKSKATETTASYLNFIGKKIQSGLKDVGLDNVANNFIPSGESDDDEEERMDLENGDYSAKTKSGDAKIIRCGAKAFADEMLSGNGGEETESESPKGSLVCYLGLRRSFLDQSAGDALAAAIQHAKTSFGIDLRVDVELNDVLENDMLEALSGKDPDALEDMADRHLEAMEVIRMAEQRAAEAARAARARMQAHREAEDSFGGDFEFGDVEEFDDEEEEEFDDDDEDEDY